MQKQCHFFAEICKDQAFALVKSFCSAKVPLILVRLYEVKECLCDTPGVHPLVVACACALGCMLACAHDQNVEVLR